MSLETLLLRTDQRLFSTCFFELNSHPLLPNNLIYCHKTSPRLIRMIPGAGSSHGSNWEPPFVQIETSMGSFSVELYWKHAPRTCRNFAELAHRGYYNNTIFHRIIEGFMIQGGDPTGTGRGGSSIYGGTFADEIHGELKHAGAGILSMANAGPDTNGSQFFISLAPTQHLDGKHAIFGRIATGMKIIQKIGMVETDPQDRPKQDVKILKAFPKSEK